MSCPNPTITDKDIKIFDTISQANKAFKGAAGDSLSRTRSGVAYSSMSGGEKKAGIAANIIAGALCFAMAGGSSAAVYLLMTTPSVAQAFGIVTPCTGAFEQVLSIFGGWVGMSCAARQSAWDATLTRAMTLTGVASGGSAVLAIHKTIADFVHDNTGKCKRSPSSSSSLDYSASQSRSRSRSPSPSESHKTTKRGDTGAAGARLPRGKGGSRRYKNGKKSRSRKSRKYRR